MHFSQNGVKFHQDLHSMMVDIRSVHQHPKNPNNGDVDVISESILAHGFFNPIIVQRRTNLILAGNHRYAALLSLGVDAVPVVWADVDDEQALRILLADNRTAEVAVRDSHEVERLLKELEATEAGLLGTGYDADALLELETLNRAYNHIEVGSGGYGEGNDEDYDPDYTKAVILVYGKYDEDGVYTQFRHEDVQEYVAQLSEHGFNAVATGDAGE